MGGHQISKFLDFTIFTASLAKKIEENGVRYEFGPCLYLGYVFGFIVMVPFIDYKCKTKTYV